MLVLPFEPLNTQAFTDKGRRVQISDSSNSTTKQAHSSIPQGKTTPASQLANQSNAVMFANEKQQQQQVAGSSTLYVASTSTRNLQINCNAVPVNNNQHTMYPLPQAQPIDVTIDEDPAPLQKKPKLERVAMLFVFHALNMCLGAVLSVPSALMTLVSLPLLCQRDGSSCSVLVNIACTFARLDIRLTNFIIPYLGTHQPPIELSPRLDAGSGLAMVRTFVYFWTLKLLTGLLSFIACYGTFGTVLVAIISNGTITGIPGVVATFAETPGKYLLYVLLRFLIGCLCVLRVAPRSVKATKAFCGLRDVDREEAVLNAV